jgi:hypothetical protein
MPAGRAVLAARHPMRNLLIGKQLRGAFAHMRQR